MPLQVIETYSAQSLTTNFNHEVLMMWKSSTEMMKIISPRRKPGESGCLDDLARQRRASESRIKFGLSPAYAGLITVRPLNPQLALGAIFHTRARSIRRIFYLKMITDYRFPS
jgi:hypothetical protein